MRLLAVLIPLLATLALALAVPAAHASTTQTVTFEAPRDLLVADRRPAALDELGSLGVHALRVIVHWKEVAPRPTSRRRPSFDATDPAAYDWGQYDALLAAARERGWRVLVTISSPVPRWATQARRDDLTRPRPAEFQKFVTAVGRHYGAQVNWWSIWNEPNQPQFLKPQYVKGTKTPLSPRIYRALYLAGHRGLVASGNGRDTILLGETSPVGTGKVVAPLTFLRGMLCLDSRYHRTRRCGRLPASGYAHHPYTTRVGPFFRPPSANAVTIGVLGRLTTALDRAARAGALPAHLPLYLTEFGVQSTPDRFSGVSLTQQVAFRAISERIAWSNPRVRSFSQYLLRDSDSRPNAPLLARYPGFESGLRFANGRVKPALAGFRLSLAGLRSGSSRTVSLWGLVRPATGPVSAELQVRDRKARSYRRLRTVRTNARGYFVVRVGYRAGRRWRLRFGGFTGAPVQAYRRP